MAHFAQLVALVPRSWKCAHVMDSLLEGKQLSLQSSGRDLCDDLCVEPQVGDTFHVSGMDTKNSQGHDLGMPGVSWVTNTRVRHMMQCALHATVRNIHAVTVLGSNKNKIFLSAVSL